MKPRPPNYNSRRADAIRKERGATPLRTVQEVVRRGEVTKDAVRRRGKVKITLAPVSVREAKD